MSQELPIIAGVIVVLFVGILYIGVLLLWGRWVAKRKKSLLFDIAAWLPLAALGTFLLGVVLTVSDLWTAFKAFELEHTDTAQKQAVVGEAISSAMNAQLVFTPIAAVVLFVGVTFFLFGTVRS